MDPTESTDHLPSLLLRAASEYKISTNTPTDLARAAEFFSNYPRFTSNKTFNTENDYIKDVFLLALPYIITGFLLVVIGIAFNVFIFRRRRSADDVGGSSDEEEGAIENKDRKEEEEDEYGENRTKTGRASLVFTGWLFGSIFALIGMGLVANYGIRAALDGARSSTDAYIMDFKLGVGVSADFVREVRERLGEFSGGNEGQVEVLRERLEVVEGDVGEVEEVVEGVTSFAEEVVDSISTTRWVVNLGISLLLFAFVVGLGFVFTTNLISDHSHVVRIVLLILFLLPLGIVWSMTGFLTTAGVISADFCAQLREYQETVLEQRNADDAATLANSVNNVLLRSNLQCPRALNNEAVSSFLSFLDISDRNDDDLQLVGGLLTVFGESGSESVEQALNGMRRDFDEVASCDSTARWAARMGHHMCSGFDGSLITSVLLLWLIFIALSVMLLLVFVTAMTGFAVAEFATAHEMLKVHGLSDPPAIEEASEVEEGLTLRTQLGEERITTKSTLPPGTLRKQSSFFGSATPRQRSSFYSGTVRRKGSGASSNASSGKSSRIRKTSSTPTGKYVPFSQIASLPSRDQAEFFSGTVRATKSDG